MNVINQVFSTTDYSKLKKLVGNREINQLHIKRLKESFKKSYLLSPILVNDKFEIIDGQHRFEAAKELGLPVNFVIVQGYGLNEVHTLNSNMKNYRKLDFLDGYCDLKYPAYLQFKYFMEQYPEFSISACELLLVNRLAKDSHKVKYFQEGELEIPDYNLSCKNAEKLLMIKPYYDGYNRRTFVSAMMGLFNMKQYNHAQLLSRLKASPTALQHCATVAQYRTLIEEIYNYRSRNKVSLRF